MKLWMDKLTQSALICSSLTLFWLAIQKLASIVGWVAIAVWILCWLALTEILIVVEVVKHGKELRNKWNRKN